MTTSSRPPVRHRWHTCRVVALTGAITALALGTVAPAPAEAAVPTAPTRLLAIASPGSARVGFFPPASDGGSAITGYRITVSTGRVVNISHFGGPATVTGLTNGVAVTFRVAAVNADGIGPSSTPSNAVTPTAATSTNTWGVTGAMTHGRDDAATTRLRNGKVLVLGGRRGDDPADRTTELYNPTTGAWTATASMDAGRTGFTSSLLPDGRVLVTGGYTDNFSVVHRTTRLYNPSTDTWSVGGLLQQARVGHTATLLPGGRVLVTGGWTGTAATRTAELYNPATNTWTFTGPMASVRVMASATLRLDGKVLVAGGTNASVGLRTAEVYTPATGTWATTASMSTVRENDEICCKEAVLLASGRILVAGGYSTGVLRSAEIYNPATGTWAPTGSMKVGRQGGFGLVRLPNRKVLAVGGLDDYGQLKYAELYNETTGTWTRVNDLKVTRFAASVMLLTNGKVLVAGGLSPRGELFKPT